MRRRAVSLSTEPEPVTVRVARTAERESETDAWRRYQLPPDSSARPPLVGDTAELSRGLAFLRVRGIERVRLHADLTMLGRLALALPKARAIRNRRVGSYYPRMRRRWRNLMTALT
jgi:hypothetical protein